MIAPRPLVFLRALSRFLWALVLRRPLFVKPETAIRRLAHCHKCPFYVEDSKQCAKCSCFAEIKTLLATERCPVGKWNRSWSDFS